MRPSGRFFYAKMPEIDAQWIANGLFTTIGLLVGWQVNSVRDSIRDLKAADEKLATKVQHIEVLVAGKYATRDEVRELGSQINEKLDRIVQKLDSKADK